VTIQQDAPEARREFPGAGERDDALLRHVVSTGSIWFAAAAVTAAVGTTGLLAAGWRPGDLPALAEVAWWAGAVLVVLGSFGLAWAGCPVVTDDPGSAAARKSLSIRAGLVAFLAGMVVSALAVLLG
jgi:hypothetical protein